MKYEIVRYGIVRYGEVRYGVRGVMCALVRLLVLGIDCVESTWHVKVSCDHAVMYDEVQCDEQVCED